MNAEEARKKSFIIKENKLKLEYDSIKRAIERAVGEGRFDITWEDIGRNTREKLEDEGFYVGPAYTSGNNEYSIKISW